MDSAGIVREGVTSGRRRRAAIASLALAGIAAMLAAVYLVFDEPRGPSPPPGTTSAAGERSAAPGVAAIRDRLSGLQGPAADPADAETTRAWRCRLESLDQYAAFDARTGAAQLADVAAALAASGNVEHVLAAAILSDTFAKASVDALTARAIALGPGHPLVLWWAADQCTRSAQPDACRDPALQRRILAAHRDNGAYWAMIANQRLRNGSDREALLSLQRAATSATMDQHMVQHALLLERGLAAIGDFGSAERAIVALFVAPLSGDLTELFAACRERPQTDAVWAQACLDWGRRLASESTGGVHKLFGYSVQQHVLEQLGPSAELAAINAKRQALRDDMNVISEDWMMLMLVDHQFSAQFLDQLAANGEIAAVRFAGREILRLRADPDYDPCALADFSSESDEPGRDRMLRAP